MKCYKITAHLLIKVSRHLLFLHGFTQYDLEFLRYLEGPSLNGMRGCKTSIGFSTILYKVFYTASAVLLCPDVTRPERDRASE